MPGRARWILCAAMALQRADVLGQHFTPPMPLPAQQLTPWPAQQNALGLRGPMMSPAEGCMGGQRQPHVFGLHCLSPQAAGMPRQCKVDPHIDIAGPRTACYFRLHSVALDAQYYHDRCKAECQMDVIQLTRDASYCDFSGRSCLGCDFSLTNIEGANFNSCDLRKADFTGATADQYTTFHRANLEGATFDGLYGMGADFYDANLRFSTFMGATLDGCSFVNANLERAILQDASMVSEACVELPTSFQHATMQQAVLQDANIKGAIFNYVDALEANFYYALLRYAGLLAGAGPCITGNVTPEPRCRRTAPSTRRQQALRTRRAPP